MADKYKVRDLVESKIGPNYLIPILWHGNTFTIDAYESLPNEFVIKSNHASGTNLIVKDKSLHSFNSILKKTNEWLAMDYDKVNFEKHYKYIDKKLIVEELLKDDGGNIPSDYKVHVFRDREGNVRKFIQVDYDRFDEGGFGHRRNLFDSSWMKINAELAHDNNSFDEPKPGCLDEMLRLSEDLSMGMGYIRCDWYIINNRLFFGEITLTHGAGTEVFSPDIVDYEWGSYWDLKSDLVV